MRISDWSSDVCSSDLPVYQIRRNQIRKLDPLQFVESPHRIQRTQPSPAAAINEACVTQFEAKAVCANRAVVATCSVELGGKNEIRRQALVCPPRVAAGIQ